jgi:replication factor A1
VQFHYALVDDLITREEFDRRVEEKIASCGDLVDELTAAILVVQECGRHHVKISGLSAKSSLFSFFGKVIGKQPLKEFTRADGEKGIVGTLVVGDETGVVNVVLWDEKAMALEEISCGEVLEIIGRHPGKGPAKDIYALALRKVDCEISCDATGGTPAPERVLITAILIAVEEPRTYTRRDGTPGEMLAALIGNEEGSSRLVAWVPGLLASFEPGTCLRITGALVKERDQGKEYSIDEKSTVIRSEEPVAFSFSPIGVVGNTGIYSVRGNVKWCEPPRSFVTRNKTRSWVRNMAIADGSGEIRAVLWGERALQPLIPGDPVTIYHASVKQGRSGGNELQISWGSVFEVNIPPGGEPITFEGTVMATRSGTFIDDGTTWYLIDAELPNGRDVRVEGTVSGRRLTVRNAEAVERDPEELIRQFDQFLLELAGQQ